MGWKPHAISLAATALIASSALAEGVEKPAERYRLTEIGGGLGIEVDQTIVFSAMVDKRGRTRWLVERRRVDHNWCGAKDSAGKCKATDTAVHDWADSNSCSELGFIIEGFSDFRSTVFTVQVSDTPLITLHGHIGKDGVGTEPLTTIEYIGPLATWWRQGENELKSCWRAEPPTASAAGF